MVDLDQIPIFDTVACTCLAQQRTVSQVCISLHGRAACRKTVFHTFCFAIETN